MTKKIFLTALCALALCPAFAQTSGTEEKVEYSTDKYKVETNSFWDNTFVSLGVGGNIYLVTTISRWTSVSASPRLSI